MKSLRIVAKFKAFVVRVRVVFDKDSDAGVEFVCVRSAADKVSLIPAEAPKYPALRRVGRRTRATSAEQV